MYIFIIFVTILTFLITHSLIFFSKKIIESKEETIFFF